MTAGPFEGKVALVTGAARGAYSLMYAFAPGMKERGGGFIVNLGSLREVPQGLEHALAVPLGPASPTSKVAVLPMSTLAASELAKDGIVVFTLAPGPAVTESFVHNAAKFGFDPSFGTPVDLPVRAVSTILTANDPMRYAARYIDAIRFASSDVDAPLGQRLNRQHNTHRRE